MKDKKQTIFPITAFFKGVGQIMLQNNAWTGLFFMTGIFCSSLIMGVAIVVAVMTGTLTAKLLKYDIEAINNGLYGFSAALVAAALTCFFQPTIIIWIAVLAGSALAPIVQHFFIAKKAPAFTFPFILITWILLAVFHYFPTLVQSQPKNIITYTNSYLSLYSRGFGQIIFQDNILAGIFFILGVFISRPIAAIYAIVSIALSSIMAYLLKESVNDIYLGLLSYNAVLCAITFAGKKVEDLLSGLIAVALSVIIMIQMKQTKIPALTFPFVLASWLVMIIKLTRQKIVLKLKH